MLFNMVMCIWCLQEEITVCTVSVILHFRCLLSNILQEYATKGIDLEKVLPNVTYMTFAGVDNLMEENRWLMIGRSQVCLLLMLRRRLFRISGISPANLETCQNSWVWLTCFIKPHQVKQMWWDLGIIRRKASPALRKFRLPNINKKFQKTSFQILLISKETEVQCKDFPFVPLWRCH